MKDSSADQEAIMAALLSLPSATFSDLIRALAADLRLRRRRLAYVLLSPYHFALTLSHLHSLSLPEKTRLLARLLLFSLYKLIPPSISGATSRTCPALRLRDLDAALLLLALCDSYDSGDPRSLNWISAVAGDVLQTALSPSGLGDAAWVVVCHYVDLAVKCRRLLQAITGEDDDQYDHDHRYKAEQGAGASVAAVVALPSVEGGEGRECVICKEEMRARRDVCELPCKHRFHWGCAVEWLRRSNTCPCCRHELPTEDVFAEMARLWRVVHKLARP